VLYSNRSMMELNTGLMSVVDLRIGKPNAKGGLDNNESISLEGPHLSTFLEIDGFLCNRGLGSDGWEGGILNTEGEGRCSNWRAKLEASFASGSFRTVFRA
jgi:hypothetical protein